MITAKLRLWWQKIRRPVGIIGIIVAGISVVVLVFVVVRLYGTGFVGKTLWDWIGLLAALAIPVVVAFGTLWFTAQQAKVSDRENNDNQREMALQAYINKISNLLLKEHLGELTADGKLKPEYDQVRNIARVRTLTVLPRLDGKRKRSLLLFLYEAGLIGKDKAKCIIDLRGADLREVDLTKVNLTEANLTRALLNGANLTEAILTKAELFSTELREANLTRALLNGANLTKAHLNGANLFEANLFEANLLQAVLNNADLRKADLHKAGLVQANLTEANLSEARVTEEQLKIANSLEGAIMPDGSKHP